MFIMAVGYFLNNHPTENNTPFIFLVKFAIFGKTVKSETKTNRASLAPRFSRA